MSATITTLKLAAPPLPHIAHIGDWYANKFEGLLRDRRAAAVRLGAANPIKLTTRHIAGHSPAGSPDAWRG